MVRPRAVRASPEPALVSGVRSEPPIADVTDEELVERARRGDRWAEEALFRKHVDYIAALSFRLMRSTSEAEDVVQDTFVDALWQLRELAEPRSLRSWLAGIAVHKAHRRFRTRKLRAMFGLHVSTHDAVLEASAPPSTSPELRAELGLLDQALSSVPDVVRAAWLLRYVEGHALEDVATLCGCSLATAKRRISRAQAQVREHVGVDGTEDGGQDG